MGGNAMWIILGIVLGVIACIFVFTAVRDKVKKNKRIKKDKNHKIKAENYAFFTLLKLDYLFEKNKIYLKEFEPSIGRYKMGEITETPRKYLNQLQKTDDFKEFLAGADELGKILKWFIAFRDTRSTKWESTLEDIAKIIKKEIAKQELELFVDDLSSIKTEIDQFYTEELERGK